MGRNCGECCPNSDKSKPLSNSNRKGSSTRQSGFDILNLDTRVRSHLTMITFSDFLRTVPLVCPDDRALLALTPTSLLCGKCGRQFAVFNDRIADILPMQPKPPVGTDAGLHSELSDKVQHPASHESRSMGLGCPTKSTERTPACQVGAMARGFAGHGAQRLPSVLRYIRRRR